MMLEIKQMTSFKSLIALILFTIRLANRFFFNCGKNLVNERQTVEKKSMENPRNQSARKLLIFSVVRSNLEQL